ncbi:MAG: hypothetical protein KatS3mg001_249 [Candidatus Pacearchaeota archaeon]|nr:MAG: hypothetical protein KatS3mg001_249 [Candidatus Pacearchaeota archaeon]
MRFFNKKEVSKKGQITIFIIISLLILAAIVLFVFLRGKISIQEVPVEFQPVYSSFLTCLETDLSTAINIAETQGGYIYLPEFEPGSDYMPFSSQLNFLGNPIPYWYYVSGNNFDREQVPTKKQIEEQISNYIKDSIKNCNFNTYNDQGFEISLDEPSSVKVNIKDDKVELNLNTNLNIEKENSSVIINNHKTSINSKLGQLYDSSLKVYNQLKENKILENYTIDVLTNYAPVDGFELSCSPLIWNADEVFDNIQNSLEHNIISINNKQEKYFTVDFGISEKVSFLTSKNWPHNLEVYPTQGNLMVSTPIGNQPGLGILGFCYVPYHFVYNIKYPVLVQVQKDQEIFQFPFAVIIENNKPREEKNITAFQQPVPEVCQFKNTEVEVRVINEEGIPVKSNISYECLSNRCFIGETSDNGNLKENFPQCINGYVVAQAPGYSTARYLLSTNLPGKVDIIMEKLYNKNIELLLDGRRYSGNAVINFISDQNSLSLFYPEQKNIDLSEGSYEIQVIIYKNSSLKFGNTISQQCIEVPRSGIFGVFGAKEERCFDIQIPEQLITNVISGGGKTQQYILESDLINSKSIEINVKSFQEPESLEQLQENYDLLDTTNLDINFK